MLKFFHEIFFWVVLDLLQLPHGRNSKYLVKNGIFKILERVIDPEEIEKSMVCHKRFQFDNQFNRDIIHHSSGVHENTVWMQNLRFHIHKKWTLSWPSTLRLLMKKKSFECSVLFQIFWVETYLRAYKESVHERHSCAVLMIKNFCQDKNTNHIWRN